MLANRNCRNLFPLPFMCNILLHLMTVINNINLAPISFSRNVNNIWFKWSWKNDN